MLIIPIIVLAVVFLLIALRQLADAKLQHLQLTWLKIPVGRRTKLEIWHIMLFGALAVLFTGQISPLSATTSINLDIILFLFGMFVVGRALEESGYLSHLSQKLFGEAKNSDYLLLIILFGMGIASAFLMNDTMAIIGTPVVIMLAKSHNIQAKPLLLALAFAITIGGVMSPIGNPQNLLIATGSNMHNAFADFFTHLLIPTLINLLVAFALLKYFYKIDTKELKPIESKITDEKLARIVKISLFLLIVFIFLKILVVSSGLLDFRLTYIALIAAAPIILFSKKRFDIIRNIDWHTLIFFVSMFVLMQSVWEAGLFQTLISGNILSIGLILVLGVVISQFISNVPMVALYLPMLVAAGASSKEFVALAAGSTIAGNLFILGAASNIIIIQNAERYGETITFKEFAKIGIPLTIVNIFVYWVFLTFI